MSIPGRPLVHLLFGIAAAGITGSAQEQATPVPVPSGQIRIDPRAQTLFQRAEAAQKRGALTAAVADYEAALRITPDYAQALDAAAWLLATASDPKVHNPVRAVQLAERLVDLTHILPRSANWSREFRIHNAYTLSVAYAAAHDDLHAFNYAQLANQAARRLNAQTPSSRAAALIEATDTGLRTISANVTFGSSQQLSVNMAMAACAGGVLNTTVMKGIAELNAFPKVDMPAK